jgi:Rieske 2Fe-2S family protein
METRYLLPPEAYFSAEWFEREQRLLFGATWHLAASLEELAVAGDYVTIQAGFDPLIVTRGLDGELRAFHNLCTHRGIQLMAGAGNSRSGLSCPYHAWSFGLDGALRSVPQPEQFPGLDLSTCGLPAASVGEWGGNVYVHPDPQAGSIDEWLGGLPGAIGSYRPELLVEVAHFELQAAANWKYFVENHVDVYHLWYLHAQTLSDYNHNVFAWQQLGRNWASYEPAKADRKRRPASGTPQIAHINERDRNGVGAHKAFPNVLMASEAEYFMTYVARPTGPESMVVDVRIRAEADADVDAIRAGVEAFVREDIAACEGIQRAIRSSRYRVGPMAVDHERPITIFQTAIAGIVGSG